MSMRETFLKDIHNTFQALKGLHENKYFSFNFWRSVSSHFWTFLYGLLVHIVRFRHPVLQNYNTQ